MKVLFLVITNDTSKNNSIFYPLYICRGEIIWLEIICKKIITKLH